MSRTGIRILIGLGLVAAVGFGLWCWKGCKPKHPNVFLIVLDTLRADHLGSYGYERKISPTLDAFAKESLRFPFALTPAPWTPPAVGSMFTGLYASAHGMMPPNGRNLARKASSSLDEKNETLAEIFRANGYQTAGVTPNPWIKPEFGYNQGFDAYYYRDRARAEEITRAASKILDSFVPDRPFFAFIHYLDPHDPYDPPPAYRDLFKEPLHQNQYTPEVQKDIDLYDGEISYLDTTLKQLFDDIKNRNLWNNSIIVIVADHGEQFMERGNQGHGFQLYNEEVHVPLIVKAPDVEPGEIEQVVTTLDIFPTILELAHIKVPPQSQGLSLLDRAALKKRPGVMSEINRKYNWKAFTAKDGNRLILDFSGADEGKGPVVVGLFDSKKDYYMKNPVNDEQRVKELRVAFDALYEGISENQIQSKQVEVGNETLEQLKSLGYMK